MRRQSLIILGLLFGLSWRSVVYAEDPATPQSVAQSTPSVTAEPAAKPAVPESAPAVAPPTPNSAPAPSPALVPARTGLNEMKGTLLSKSDDPRSLRLTVDGGFNVEFAYDSKTTFINGGNPITANDLNYGDEILIHYSGKELVAIDVDRLHKAARPQ